MGRDRKAAMPGRRAPGFCLALSSVVSLALCQEIVTIGNEMPEAESWLGVSEGTGIGKISVALKGVTKGAKPKNEYARIPNFVLRHMAQELNVGNRLECERICDKKKSCLSYSW